MRNIFLPLLFIGILTVSCDKKLEFAQVIRKKSDLIKEKNKKLIPEDPYEVKFHPITPKYKLETREIVENFYNERINRRNFWGQFLVAKNGQVIYEDYKGYSNYQDRKSTRLNSSHVRISY